jgi:hypothetical protein
VIAPLYGESRYSPCHGNPGRGEIGKSVPGVVLYFMGGDPGGGFGHCDALPPMGVDSGIPVGEIMDFGYFYFSINTVLATSRKHVFVSMI